LIEEQVLLVGNGGRWSTQTMRKEEGVVNVPMMDDDHHCFFLGGCGRGWRNHALFKIYHDVLLFSFTSHLVPKPPNKKMSNRRTP